MARRSEVRSARRLLLAALALAFLLAAPQVAWARSLGMTRADIAAFLGTDGSLTVVEQRTYQSKGSYSGILWDVRQGSYQGREVRASVAEVSVVTDGQRTALQEGREGVPGTYELADKGDHLQLKVFWPMEEESVTFEVAYVLGSVATRWADVGELYWQYVPADEQAQGEWLNVSCSVSLPVPEGVAVQPGENVRAWGHGPIDGEVSFEGNGVRLFSPGVGSAEFLEVRVAFPAEWLADVPVTDEARLDAILAEEDQWAREANSRRWKARLVAYGYPAFMCLAGIGSALFVYRHNKRRRQMGPAPQFSETYYRDVPTDDHPAVLGMLFRAGQMHAADLSATLMRLADRGAIALDAVNTEKAGKHGTTKSVREWQLTRCAAPRAGGVDARSKRIDDAALSFVFDAVGTGQGRTHKELLASPSGGPSVLMSDFAEVAEKWPMSYQKGYDGWVDAVQAAYDERGFVAKNSDDLVSAIMGLGCFALAVIFAVAGMFMGVPNFLLCVGFIVWFGAGIYIVLSDNNVPSVTYTQEAMDVRAKLAALKRWLEEFTNLEEAIPTSVVLWNRLLVMATVLGVADKVVAQLKVHMPELLADPGFRVYRWHDPDLADGLAMPAASIGRAVSEASRELHHDVSTGSAASSRSSSSRGSGGGFSSGGGGGFSGGGGRGGGF